MGELHNVAQIGALIGDPVRAAMLGVLMDGGERPAGELAALSGIAPQTASSHLARLVEGGLLVVTNRGRNRCYRLRDADIAHAIETLSVAADLATRRRSSIDPDLRRARRCYDHIAGELGVAICDALISDGRVVAGGDGFAISTKGNAWLEDLKLADAGGGRRPAVRPCVDWSERRPHLAGWLGAALCDWLTRSGAIRKRKESRVLGMTPQATPLLRRHFGLDWRVS